MTYSPKVKIALRVEEVKVEKKSAIAVTTRISTNINCTAWKRDALDRDVVEPEGEQENGQHDGHIHQTTSAPGRNISP
jgi:hypothetical protein